MGKEGRRGGRSKGGGNGNGQSGGLGKYIVPTGKCFDDSLDLLIEILKLHPDWVTTLRLVHAICTMPDGRQYAHAWVEDLTDDSVAFYGLVDGERMLFKAVTRQDYYDQHGLVELRRYTYPEALRENRRTTHYGPWVEHYRALCGSTSIVCPKCGWATYNPNDIRERYCGHCHVFWGDE